MIFTPQCFILSVVYPLCSMERRTIVKMSVAIMPLESTGEKPVDQRLSLGVLEKHFGVCAFAIDEPAHLLVPVDSEEFICTF